MLPQFDEWILILYDSPLAQSYFDQSWNEKFHIVKNNNIKLPNKNVFKKLLTSHSLTFQTLLKHYLILIFAFGYFEEGFCRQRLMQPFFQHLLCKMKDIQNMEVYLLKSIESVNGRKVATLNFTCCKEHECVLCLHLAMKIHLHFQKMCLPDRQS